MLSTPRLQALRIIYRLRGDHPFKNTEITANLKTVTQNLMLQLSKVFGEGWLQVSCDNGSQVLFHEPTQNYCVIRPL